MLKHQPERPVWQGQLANNSEGAGRIKSSPSSLKTDVNFKTSDFSPHIVTFYDYSKIIF